MSFFKRVNKTGAGFMPPDPSFVSHFSLRYLNITVSGQIWALAAVFYALTAGRIDGWDTTASMPIIAYEAKNLGERLFTLFGASRLSNRF